MNTDAEYVEINTFGFYGKETHHGFVDDVGFFIFLNV